MPETFQKAFKMKEDRRHKDSSSDFFYQANLALCIYKIIDHLHRYSYTNKLMAVQYPARTEETNYYFIHVSMVVPSEDTNDLICSSYSY